MLTSVRESNSRREPRHWPQIYFGVAATSLATLLLELALTRVFSVVYFYHFAFLAISIALFGLGAGGVFSYVVEDWHGSLYRKLGILAAANAIAVVLSLTYLLGRAGDLSLGAMGIVYLITAIPFVLSGAIVSLAISDTIERVNRVYFFDLLGAAGGCALLVPLLDRLGRSKHDSGRLRASGGLRRHLVSPGARLQRPHLRRSPWLAAGLPDYLQRKVFPH